MKTKIETLDNGEIKMIVSIDKDEFESYRDKGFKKVQEFVQIDGFRKGNAPENMIVEKYGDMIILEEMAHLAINATYYESLKKENETRKDDDKVFPIHEPKISITKIGKGSEFEYVASFAVLPKINLVDYKKISKEESKKATEDMLAELKKQDESVNESDILKVSEKEVDDLILNLRKTRGSGAHVHEDGTVHTESHDHSNDPENNTDELPPLDDAFAQSFGENFKTLEDLKNKIKENLELEKKAKLLDKKRNLILERLVNETETVLPEVLLEDELERMKVQMKSDVERFGAKWDEYLVHLKKTEEELKNEWRDMARKRVLSQLILNEIAKKEKLEVSKEEIDVESLKILADMPEANEDHVNSYVHQILLNEKVMKLLDGESK